MPVGLFLWLAASSFVEPTLMLTTIIVSWAAWLLFGAPVGRAPDDS